MESRRELNGIRVSVTEAADILGKHPSHLRRLWKRGVIPAPRKTANGRPYFDDELLRVIMAVMESGIGLNGEEVLFYRRRAKTGRHNRKTLSGKRSPTTGSNPYILGLQDALAQLGISKDRLDPDVIQVQLKAAFGNQWPEPETVLPELAKRLRA